MDHRRYRSGVRDEIRDLVGVLLGSAQRRGRCQEARGADRGERENFQRPELHMPLPFSWFQVGSQDLPDKRDNGLREVEAPRIVDRERPRK